MCSLGNTALAIDDLEKYEKECLSIIEKPSIQITAAYGNLMYDFSKDRDFLKNETEIKFKENGLRFPVEFEPIGLTKVRDTFNFNMTVGQIEISRNYECVFPKTITVHLGYVSPTIYILKDLKKQSCLYEVALRHEKTHMQIYIEALDYFLPEFKKEVNNLFETVGVKILQSGQNGKLVAKELNTEYVNTLKNKVDIWRKDVEKEQVKLDTPEHYLLESKLCAQFDED